MAMSHEHAYLKKKGRGGNEYQVISVPLDVLPEDLPGGYRRVTRKDALADARWTWDDGPSYVTVTPCACGSCGLSEYAEAHEGSALAKRVRKAKRELQDGAPDILGRQKRNPYTGEYDGELPRYRDAACEA